MSARYTEKFGFKTPGNVLNTVPNNVLPCDSTSEEKEPQEPEEPPDAAHDPEQPHNKTHSTNQSTMAVSVSTANNVSSTRSINGYNPKDRAGALQNRNVAASNDQNGNINSNNSGNSNGLNYGLNVQNPYSGHVQGSGTIPGGGDDDETLVSPVVSTDTYSSGIKEFPSFETSNSNQRHISFDAQTQSRPSHNSYNSLHMHSRSRSRSFNETSQEALKQLAPPVSVPLVLCCFGWYATSAMSNTLNKTILTHFPYPVTLSMVQFLLAALFGSSLLILAKEYRQVSRLLPKGLATSSGLRLPTKEILVATAPMGLFQLTGHIMSHMSTQLIPLSLVHTIKALSPLFTVTAYRFLFHVKYNPSTYLSLVPLTIGVIMTCSSELSANIIGYIYALVSTLIFVSQNMFAKKLLTHGRVPGSSDSAGSDDGKLDKLNVLCYCSSLAFVFTSPLWFFSEGLTIMIDYSHSQGAFFGGHHATEGITELDDYTGSQLLGLFLSNGLVHFIQNLLAFQVLGMVSPVTYSVASLIKRIVVITVAILWFNQTVSTVQGWGILLTFIGLYLYDRCGGDKHQRVEVKKSDVLPR